MVCCFRHHLLIQTNATILHKTLASTESDSRRLSEATVTHDAAAADACMKVGEANYEDCMYDVMVANDLSMAEL